jgi:phosphopantothenoylcysteine decarboxylase/phosphopantothenate--cysteine ligase
MKVIVTCGPSYEPIDEVRRLTNFSTGELGVSLARALAAAGHEVFCLKGSGATAPGPEAPARLELFNTNDDLLAALRGLASGHAIGALFHVAALCDYRIAQVRDESGQTLASPKIASRAGALTLQLEPATKVIVELRGLFPNALLVGWKYELAGTREEAFARAWRQIRESHVDACVLNGRAYGDGFAVCQREGQVEEIGSRPDLVNFLVAQVSKRVAAGA